MHFLGVTTHPLRGCLSRGIAPLGVLSGPTDRLARATARKNERRGKWSVSCRPEPGKSQNPGMPKPAVSNDPGRLRERRALVGQHGPPGTKPGVPSTSISCWTPCRPPKDPARDLSPLHARHAGPISARPKHPRARPRARTPETFRSRRPGGRIHCLVAGRPRRRGRSDVPRDSSPPRGRGSEPGDVPVTQ